MIGFESLLEKDYFILLEYDDEVSSFEEQPVRIPLVERGTSYVPDVLIRFRPVNGVEAKAPVLAEVKTTQDLEKNRVKYSPKFSAAKKWATDKGWAFKTRSEKDIRGLRLEFLKFLREYHSIDPSPLDIAEAKRALEQLGGQATYRNLIDTMCVDDDARLQMIPVVWHLVATRQFVVDLDQPISDEVRLKLPVRRSKS